MWVNLLVALTVGFLVTMLANLATTIYLHRTLAHRAMTMRPGLAWFFRLVIWMSVGIRPRQWVAVHRKHHAFTDVEGDPHSPALLGWGRVQLTNVALYRKVANDPEQVARYARDLPADRWDRILFDHAFLGLGIGIVFLCVVLGPIWGIVASLFHAVTYLALSGAVNAAGHTFGRQPFENSARNLQWLAFLTAGEGLHNNHHAAPTSAKLAMRKIEIDPAWWFIAMFRKLGWVKVRLDKVVLAPVAPARTAA
jgi:stearoyl-CoA desaturase (delta-9 desaturase)